MSDLIDTLIIDIHSLRERIRKLTRNISLKQKAMNEEQVFSDLRSLLGFAHELRGHIKNIDVQEENIIREFTNPKTRFNSKDPDYNGHLEKARAAHNDDVAIIRELGACITATQLVLHERSRTGVWEGVRHLIHELKRLESLLERLRQDLQGA